MENNLVVEAFKFMILGMTIVYLLLALMVYLMGVQHKIIEKYFPDKPQDSSSSSNSTPNRAAATSSNSDEENQVVAAIVAAITKYKQN